VHAWIYRLTDGLIRDLGFSANHTGGVRAQHDGALASLKMHKPEMRRSHGV
jgi:hypothetical protein